MKIIAILLSLSFALLSCSKTITCTDPPINFAFISFPLGDIDTLVLKKFSPGTNFQNLIDTISLFNNINSSTVMFGDTARISVIDPDRTIKPGSDWQIFIPATNRTIYISNITKENKTDKCATFSTQCYCYNKILSIKLDNQNGTFITYPSHVLYIR